MGRLGFSYPAADAALRLQRAGGIAVDTALTATLLQGIGDYHQNRLFGSLPGPLRRASDPRHLGHAASC